MFWGRGHREKALVRRFVAALNAHDVGALEAMMVADFAYIDSWREGVEGRETVLAAVRLLFETDPRFGVEVEQMSYQAPFVRMSGRITSARFGEGRRAVWQAVCDGKRLSSWQSWAEGGPPPMTRALAPEYARDMSGRASDQPELGES